MVFLCATSMIGYHTNWLLDAPIKIFLKESFSIQKDNEAHVLSHLRRHKVVDLYFMKIKLFTKHDLSQNKNNKTKMNIITKSLNFNVTYIYDKKNHYLTQ